MTKKPRDVRQRERKYGLNGTTVDCIVAVDSPAWIMVRNAKSPGAAPYVITRREWDTLPPAEEWRLA